MRIHHTRSFQACDVETCPPSNTNDTIIVILTSHIIPYNILILRRWCLWRTRCINGAQSTKRDIMEGPNGNNVLHTAVLVGNTRPYTLHNLCVTEFSGSRCRQHQTNQTISKRQLHHVLISKESYRCEKGQKCAFVEKTFELSQLWPLDVG